MSKVVLVTGASTGIGKETAKLFAQNGYRVYGGARRMEKMELLKSFGITPIELDVTKEDSIAECIKQILSECGSIDILVNNAGFGAHGAIEDVTMEDAKYQLEVNVFGAMRLTQLVLPVMRKNKYGKIVNISSIGGKIAAPLSGWYHASKFALEGLSDSLRNEVKSFGIDVIVIEPGGIKSEWSSIANENLLKASGNTVYGKMAKRVVDFLTKSESKNHEPIVIAELIKKAVEARNPKTRYAKGYMAKPILFVRKIISDKLWDKLLMSQFK